jgi:hypothetical protein
MCRYMIRTNACVAGQDCLFETDSINTALFWSQMGFYVQDWWTFKVL